MYASLTPSNTAVVGTAVIRFSVHLFMLQAQLGKLLGQCGVVKLKFHSQRFTKLLRMQIRIVVAHNFPTGTIDT